MTTPKTSATATEAARQHNARLPEYFDHQEALAHVGRYYKTTGGYDNVPPGTMGEVVDIYANGRWWGIDIAWEGIPGNSPHEQDHGGRRIDGFSKRDLYGEYEGGDLAGRPFMQLAPMLPARFRTWRTAYEACDRTEYGLNDEEQERLSRDIELVEQRGNSFLTDLRQRIDVALDTWTDSKALQIALAVDAAHTHRQGAIFTFHNPNLDQAAFDAIHTFLHQHQHDEVMSL